MKLLLVKFKKRTRYKELQGLIMEETYNINNIDALLEELKEIAGELNEQILSNCPHKDINCIIGQLKGFYYNLNDNNLNDNNLLAAINKHISPKITKEELLSFGEPDEVLCIDR
jgi:hypothetical protein